MTIRVYYEDTDLGGVVYHSKYLNFCERARSNKFFSKGLSPILPEGHFVVKSMNCQFIKPALLGNELQVQTDSLSFSKASISLKQQILREGTLIFEADVVLVFMNEGKITRIPQYVMDLLSSKD